MRASAANDPITDELYGAMAAHYSKEQMIEICLTAGLSGAMARFHKTFLTDVDPETQEGLGASCPFPMPPPPSKEAPHDLDGAGREIGRAS